MVIEKKVIIYTIKTSDWKKYTFLKKVKKKSKNFLLKKKVSNSKLLFFYFLKK